MKKKKKQQPWLYSEISEEIANNVFRVKIILENGVQVVRDFVVDVDIDEECLEEEIANMPSVFLFWSTLRAEQKLQVSTYEIQIKRRRGVIVDDLIKRSGGDGNDKSKLRTTDIKEILEADDGLLKLQVQKSIAEKTLGKLYSIVDALQIKSENLRTLAANKRQEYKTL